MKRRNFIQKGALSGSFLALNGPKLFAMQEGLGADPYHQFNLNYAPHLGMFKNLAGDDPIDQLNFMADQGFTAFEDNTMRDRSVALQQQMADVMQKRSLQMGVFVAHKIYWTEPNLTSGKKDKREEFLADIKASIEVAKRVNAKWVTVVPGYVDMTQDINYQTAHVVESLKQAAALLEPHGIIMVLEPLNFYNHPGLFLKESPQAYQICKAVDSPSCKILFDVYHQQIQEGNLIPNIDDAWDEIAYFQMGDNPGRKEPTTGEINYKNIFKHIYEKGFTGVLGMEHGNSMPGAAGEQAVIDAYVSCDNFL
ncbi:hydroxypyruvate isomerase [Leeuwenhoekiella aestuarii]|uniref:Hydroxypyruvate isomerase n=1 Tax=Leeuwenhoekiella aestuarii TaxID=2249426 RepID=A0A4Q0NYU7_9FLAO|nr:TIM barrel protein [Leeuwenhoekiella aestuarii]RXG18110.1 hydroxypyruvate isomerase [Leeuwenhoekiella aestuarii]RXG19416.1 hydroxypyruvate isomerase [Leeuwenhoekiella aestuarii]